MTSDVAICRTCLAECTTFSGLHKQGIFMGEVTSLATLLNFSICVELAEDAEQPAQICDRCVQLLAKSYLFKKMVLEANDFLEKQQGESAVPHGGVRVTDIEEASMTGCEVVEQHFVGDDVEAEELQELANAAQLKRSMDDMEYVMQVLHDDSVVEVQETEVEGDGEVEVEVEGDGDGDGDGEVEADGEVEVDGETETVLEDSEEQLEINTENEAEEEVVVDHDDQSEELYQTENDDGIYVERLTKEDDDDEEQYAEETYEVTLQDVEVDDDGELTISKQTFDSAGSQSTTDGNGGHQRPKRTLRTRKKSINLKPANPEWQCQVCSKQLSNQNSFKYHMQLHSDVTPYLCSLCGEGFKTRNAYEGHIVIHDPNNPNTCELCGKAYRQSSSLRTHMLTHTGERPFQCDICGKGLTQKSGYKKHMLTHTGEKPHVCDICHREFRYSSNLFAHKRCHSGEKPYECSHCNKCFATPEQLKRHMLVHTAERPYACEFCEKKFKRRSSLLVHRQTHESLPGLVDQKLAKSNVVELY